MRTPNFLGAVVGGVLLTASFAVAQTDTHAAAVLHLRYVTVVVKNYDEALSWYTSVLGLKKTEDRNTGPGRRWLVVAPEGQADLGIVLDLAAPGSMDSAAASKDDRLGKETNWVFQVTDCRAFYEVMSKRGVHFSKPPADQPWGTTQAVFEDLYGNVFVAESKRAQGPESERRSAGFGQP
jgi:uncharacterized glyoxalase superfamily protein PhnB